MNRFIARHASRRALKPELVLFLALASLGLPVFAQASLTNLKQVQVSGGERVDLYFDGKVGRPQIKTEFFNDTIQLSLTDVSVYPAKISSVSGGDLVKLFAYQYAPKLVRCRLTVKGKAEDYRDRFQIDERGRVLTLTLNAGREEAAAPAKSAAKEDSVHLQSAQAVRMMGAGEKAILDKVLGATPVAAAQPAAVQQAPTPAKSEAQPILAGSRAQAPALGQPLGGGRPVISPVRVLGKLAIVLGLFGLLALAFRRVLQGKADRQGVFGSIRRFAANKLGQPARMIEVVSSHQLGPKKSVVVIKVAGRMLVLGITNESINLITQLEQSGTQGYGEEAPGESSSDDLAEAIGPAFARAAGVGAVAAGPARPAGGPRPSAAQARAILGSDGPAFDGVLAAAGERPAAGNARSQIRSRMEGLKPL